MSNNRVCTRLLPLADGSLDEMRDDRRDPPCTDAYTCAYRRLTDNSVVYAYANGQMTQVDADANELFRVQVGRNRFTPLNIQLCTTGPRW